MKFQKAYRPARTMTVLSRPLLRVINPDPHSLPLGVNLMLQTGHKFYRMGNHSLMLKVDAGNDPDCLEYKISGDDKQESDNGKCDSIFCLSCGFGVISAG